MLTIPQMIQQAVQLHTGGQFAEAEAIYLKVLDRAPNESAALHLLGVLRHQQGRHAEGADLVRRAIAFNPREPDAHVNLSSICRALGDVDGAIDAGRRATELQPSSASGWNNLALGLKLAKRYDEALQALNRALQLQPQYPDALMNTGNTLSDLRRHEQALPFYHSALRLRPNHPATFYNLGLALHALKREREAVQSLEEAARLNPNSAEFLATLGDVYVATEQYGQAIQVFQRALSLAPTLGRAFGNLGVALRESNRIADAIAIHRRGVEIEPDSADPHFNLGLSLLWAGEYEQGWREYEWRWQSTDFTSQPRDFSQPVWDSSIDARGKRILIHAEQGFGDTLQFVRYAPLLAARGAQVLIECQPQLVRLLRGVDGLAQVIARGEPMPDFDYRIAMMSLPFALGTSLTTIPQNLPYLSPTADDEARFKSRVDAVGASGQIKIGLAWAGNPHRQLDHVRSVTLASLAPLAEIPNVHFFSLQKLAGAEQAAHPPPGMQLTDFTPDFFDFGDTAALVSQLDLVISVDTAAAHLAGALGKPVWIMLPFAGGWRWLTERADSPWYPTARLFRQPSPGDWNSAILSVRDELARFS